MPEFSNPEVFLLLGRMGGDRARRMVLCAGDKPSKFTHTALRNGGGLNSCASTLRRDDVRLGARVVVSQTNTYGRSRL